MQDHLAGLPAEASGESHHRVAQSRFTSFLLTTYEKGFSSCDKVACQKDSKISADVLMPHCNKCQYTMQMYPLIPKYFLKLALLPIFLCL